jgi:hypothetical protein
MSHPLCPICVIEDPESLVRLEPEGTPFKTAWYGTLAYYTCTPCGSRFVVKDNGEPEYEGDIEEP